jgi:pimeloyl-ACP methyl ester carboxylesterase
MTPLLLAFYLVHGHQLDLRCTGSGPTVVLEAGINQSGETWNNVVPEIAKFARVCVYDRAGLGKSGSAGNAPRTANAIAADLHALLRAANVRAPYVLVGHSFGGLLVRTYAAAYPNDVRGMVLVDSTHEEETSRWLALLPADVRRRMEGAGALRLLGGEPVDLERSNAEAAKAHWHAGIPLVVLARGSASYSPDDYPPPLRQWAPDGEKLRIALQKELAARSPRGKLIFAERSGHFIQNDEPTLVVRAIREVIK